MITLLSNYGNLEYFVTNIQLFINSPKIEDDLDYEFRYNSINFKRQRGKNREHLIFKKEYTM